ncbi:MAG: hypothetical protein EXR21_09130 [Flavobacteriaceae bacterium]|nr:hypothetical protein [Flavobacteriaceae bacterium]
MNKKIPTGKITLSELIVRNNPNGARQLMHKYGINPPPSTTTTQAHYALESILAKHQDEALREFALCHPDKDLILINVPTSPSNPSASYKYMAYEGNPMCTCGRGSTAAQDDTHMNADGTGESIPVVQLNDYIKNAVADANKGIAAQNPVHENKTLDTFLMLAGITILAVVVLKNI